MRALVPILGFFLFALSSISATAANKYWVAKVSSNWNNTSNWSATSGGGGGTAVPGSLDAVIFDGNGLGNCTIDLNVSITSINVKAAYTGTLSQGAESITTSSTATFSGGTFSGGSADIDIQGTFTLSGTTFTSTSDVLEFNGNVAFTSGSFAHNNGTVQFNSTAAATQTISGTSPTLYIAEFVGLGRTYKISSTGSLVVSSALNLTGTSFTTINTGTLSVLGNINITNSATGGGGTATIDIDGTGNQSINGASASGYGAFPKVIINKTSGTLSLFNDISFAGDLTYTAGTLNPGTSTVFFVNTLTITGTFSVYNFTIDGSAAITLTIANGSIVTATNTLDLEDGANNIMVNTGTIAVQGNITDNNTGLSGGGTGTILIDGAASQNISATGVIDQGTFPAVTISNTGGTVTFPSLITVTGNWTYTSGALDVTTNNATVVFENTLTITGNHTLNNVTFNANAIYTITISTGTLLTVSGTLLTMGSSNLSISTPTAAANGIEAQGNITINNTGTTGGGTGGILIDGTASQALSSTAASGEGWLPYITIQKTGGTLTMSGTISATRDWTYTTGTVDAATNVSTVVFGSHNLNVKSDGMSFYNVDVISSNVTLGNDMTAAGDLTISGTGVLLAKTHTINLGGDWTNYGAAGFTEGTSTVNFDGSAQQTIATPGGQEYYNVAIDNSGSGLLLDDDVNVDNKLTMTAGNTDLNGNTVTLGTSATSTGTLKYTAGFFFDTGNFTRWFAASTPIADGNVTGLFPMGASSGDTRPFNVAAPTTAPTIGGTISVDHTYINDWRYIFVTDVDGAVLLTENDSYWTVSTGNGLTGGSYDLRGAGTGFGIINSVTDLRLILENSVVGNPATNGGTTTDPQVNRTNVSLTNLSNSFYIATTDPGDVLPVLFASFNAEETDSKVDLSWSTPIGTGASYFSIQRSKDGASWETIQQVAAVVATASNTDDYATTDLHPFTGSCYYRVLEVGSNGSQYYSAVRLVYTAGSDATIHVFPNPVITGLNILFPETGHYQVSLVNEAGQVVNRYSVENSNSLAIDVSKLSAGIYFIRIESGSLLTLKKIVVIK